MGDGDERLVKTKELTCVLLALRTYRVGTTRHGSSRLEDDTSYPWVDEDGDRALGGSGVGCLGGWWYAVPDCSTSCDVYDIL